MKTDVSTVAFKVLALISLALCVAQDMRGEDEIGVYDLTCEYLTDPLCVEPLNPRLAWKMRSGKYDQMQSAYRVLVATSRELLDADYGDLWDSGKVTSSASSQIRYDGNPVEESSRCYWKVKIWNNSGDESAWSAPSVWGSGVRHWRAAWIGDEHDGQLEDYLNYVRENHASEGFDISRWANPPVLPSPLLRRSFRLDGKPEEAVIYASALGYYELWINGNRVGDAFQTPGWTDYKDYVQYQAYDVTPYLVEGENVISAQLADGWALGRLAGVKWMHSFPHRGFYATDRRLIARLDVTMADGQHISVTTDSLWRIKSDGYVREADNFGGETIDARLVPEGWQNAGFDDSGWKKAVVDTAVCVRLVAQPDEPIKLHTELRPERIWKRGDRYMVDFGQNIAGHCMLRVNGRRGDTITVRHGEWLNDDGSLYTQSLGYAKATDRFILSGGDDSFDPAFTYHGFQYVEVCGLGDELTYDKIVAKAISSGAKSTGSFECSDPALNRLYKNIVWTQRNNMFGVMTDNPSRDERTGAMGDIQIFAQTAMFNMDMAPFFSKFVRDAGELAPNGQFMSMIPSLRYAGVWDGWIGAPGWCEAPIIVPWRMYENYADSMVQQTLYDRMKGHIRATFTENPDMIWRVRHNHNGDWLNANTIMASPDSTFSTTRGATPDDVFATAFLAYSARLLSEIAGVLGHDDDSVTYRSLAHRIKERFIEEFVTADGRVEGDTQGGYSIALYYDLIPCELREAAFAHLLRCIEEYDTRLSTGFITTPMMMQLLVDFNREDIAYKLLTSRRFPSWLYIVDNGATTVWERWDAWIPGIGFQNPSMNSLDHVAFGAVGEWMYRNILGINPDVNHPGYEHFTLKPRPGGGLTWARGAYESPRGTIKSEWMVDENGYTTFTFTIPPNSRATIVLPVRFGESVDEIGETSGNVIFSYDAAGNASATVGSGSYAFKIKK